MWVKRGYTTEGPAGAGPGVESRTCSGGRDRPERFSVNHWCQASAHLLSSLCTLLESLTLYLCPNSLDNTVCGWSRAWRHYWEVQSQGSKSEGVEKVRQGRDESGDKLGPTELVILQLLSHKKGFQTGVGLYTLEQSIMVRKREGVTSLFLPIIWVSLVKLTP